MYKTTKEENEILTRVGRGTPMGELLRRYWWPVGISKDLKDKPTFVRLMGEDLVLFRDDKGRPGILGAHCSHRRANLCLGNVEERGLRCRYHGWLYDTAGNVLQTPGEPPDSKLKEGVHHLSYPAEELGEFVFIYMGPDPAPLLPRFHFLAAEGQRLIRIQGFQNCNWLQCVENGIDPVHVSFTHAGAWPDLHSVEADTGFEKMDYGLIYKAFRQGPKEGVYNYREHYLLMPGISCGGSSARHLEGGSGTPPMEARWSLPIDDTHSLMWRIYFIPAENPGRYKRDPLGDAWREPGSYIAPYKEYKESDAPVLGYNIFPMPGMEDGIVLDSVGPIADRENEHLSEFIDAGILALREMYFEAIETVKAGGDPRGTVRDKAKNRLVVIPACEKWVSAGERKRLKEPSFSSSSVLGS